MRDTIREYAIAGNGNVKIEFIDPRDDEELETEANQKYGIRPLPFHFSDRHQAELVNSYFHILIKYGDKYEVLEFGDLIEVKSKGVSGGLDVQLRNLEYDLSKVQIPQNLEEQELKQNLRQNNLKQQMRPLKKS
ncbi:MAG: Gldg family protein [Deltaproteobacteria bacterium]|nr:Gldg family protein [Deltaproteobacteria bacterium]